MSVRCEESENRGWDRNCILSWSRVNCDADRLDRDNMAEVAGRNQELREETQRCEIEDLDNCIPEEEHRTSHGGPCGSRHLRLEEGQLECAARLDHGGAHRLKVVLDTIGVEADIGRVALVVDMDQLG